MNESFTVEVHMFALLLLIAMPSARSQTPTLKDLVGMYRGFAPTDLSALGKGEIEATITEDEIRLRLATGHDVTSEAFATNAFEPMTDVEVAEAYAPGSDVPERSFGFKHAQEYPRLLFLKNPMVHPVLPVRSEFGLVVVSGGMADLVGPTVLFSPAQLKFVSCERLLRSVEWMIGGSWRGGLIPRLDNAGLARRER